MNGVRVSPGEQAGAVPASDSRAVLSNLFAVMRTLYRDRGTADARPRAAVSRTGRGSTIGGQPSLRGVGGTRFLGS